MKTKLGISLAFVSLMVLSNCSKTDETAAGGTTAGQFDEDSSCVANPPTPTSATSALANGSTLSGKQSSSVLLGTGNTYTISGVVNFACGTELRIQPGVTIKATTASTSGLVIQRGARIYALGSNTSPIKMTSDATTPKPGDWGGLTLQGRSTWNQAGGEVTTEFDTGKAGLASGAVSADNSGTIQYTIIEFAGKKLTTTKEWNNLSLYAVGSGTTIHHLNVNRGSDDGVEFFGGTVNITYLLSFANGDDMIDWTNGWTGYVQYGIAYLAKNDTTASRDTDSNLVEADNDSTSNDLTPRSNPVLANIAFATDGGANNTANSYARIFKFRVGTYGRIYNSVVDNTMGMKIAFESSSTISAVGSNVIAYGSAFRRTYAADGSGTTLLTLTSGGDLAFANTGNPAADATTNTNTASATIWSAAVSANETTFFGTGSTTTENGTACLAGSGGGAFSSPSAVATAVRTAFVNATTCGATPSVAIPVGTTNTTVGLGNITLTADPTGWNASGAGDWMTVSTTNLP